jgi:hypothetical protein
LAAIGTSVGYERRDLAAIFDVLDQMTAQRSVAHNSR